MTAWPVSKRWRLATNVLLAVFVLTGWADLDVELSDRMWLLLAALFARVEQLDASLRETTIEVLGAQAAAVRDSLDMLTARQVTS